ncbi:electron transfer flavoprotein subunit alpha/FixB family protein [Salsipaludibacter albus]|uniref:electron transfer flavoprotein subunit alpha/FixB family protein n=1 Tax=Salsipaludibacter albus TaxID=2849650 RepID=UPI001EE42D45|nr:electron transfer flavoprotein subunit alpha/FixB family protein [Salsipaludibacter albus]MBY5162383.1 electron transfer flavoprotein subunit alpha/FixB family protein [Salsipaludibacter albus]
MIVVFVETTAGDDGDVLAGPSRQALTLARSLDDDVVAVAVDDGEVDLDEVAEDAGRYGAVQLHGAWHDLLDRYGPESWAAALDGLVEELAPGVVLAAGTERGGEVLAHVAARRDLPLVANVTHAEADDAGWRLQRVRWGGSLFEHTRLEAERVLLTVQPHAVDAVEVVDPAAAELVEHDVELDDVVARTRVVEEVVTSTGVSLATAPVVVGGGRGVGSAEGFADLERLAGLLGGAVGCSRVATNNGWRPHRDQVGQTGTAIAPTIYIACGISGAIQHWAGAKSAKHVLAINTDAEANMVARADWAVVGDLHQVVPALVAAIEAR